MAERLEEVMSHGYTELEERGSILRRKPAGVTDRLWDVKRSPCPRLSRAECVDPAHNTRRSSGLHKYLLLLWVPRLIAHPEAHFNWSECVLTFLVTGAARMVADLKSF